jgi:hypothetical protein
MSLVRALIATSVAAVMSLSACSKNSDDMRAAQPEPTADASPIAAEARIDDVRLTRLGSNTDSAAGVADAFAAGDHLQLSMQVDDAPAGTTVTAYWYGPSNQQLAYESKQVTGNQQQLTFTREIAAGWPSGSYRAEVWTGGEKVEEESFSVGAG